MLLTSFALEFVHLDEGQAKTVYKINSFQTFIMGMFGEGGWRVFTFISLKTMPGPSYCLAGNWAEVKRAATEKGEPDDFEIIGPVSGFERYFVIGSGYGGQNNSSNYRNRACSVAIFLIASGIFNLEGITNCSYLFFPSISPNT